MKAIVRFHWGNKIYEIGDNVPDEVIRKYPHLVGVVYEKEKKSIENIEEKNNVLFSPVQKIRKK